MNNFIINIVLSINKIKIVQKLYFKQYINRKDWNMILYLQIFNKNKYKNYIKNKYLKINMIVI